MAPEETSTLVKELQQGDLKSFNTLYYRYYRPVFSNICRLIRKQEDAEEILQDVFVSLWNKRETLDPDMSIGGWLMVVSQNKSINYLQKKVREKLLLMGDVTDEALQNADNKETFNIEAQLAHLDKAISNLPPKQRQAFTLCKLHLKTYGQASELLGISPHTVREYVTKAGERVKWEMLQIDADLLFITLVLLPLLSAPHYC
jgi:RNA polymerase sigma-70 factor (ECF subfamily)